MYNWGYIICQSATNGGKAEKKKKYIFYKNHSNNMVFNGDCRVWSIWNRS